MHPVIYDVAVSIDGYIDGPNQDISKFSHEGPVVDDYMDRLQTYACAIMGRRTYEFGYRFGMKPGQNPYPHMRTMVYSSTLALPEEAEVKVVRSSVKHSVRDLRQTGPGPIYLCGGGALAASLLSDGLIDRIRLKRAPILLGDGTPLFSGSFAMPDLSLEGETSYANGYLFQDFALAA